MNTVSRFLILVSALNIVGCSSIPKQEVIYTNDWQEEWKTLKLKECYEQSVLITLTTFEMRQQVGEIMTEGQVKDLQGWLMSQCIRFYKLDI